MFFLQLEVQREKGFISRERGMRVRSIDLVLRLLSRFSATGAQPEAQLNPKKKVFETIQPVCHLLPQGLVLTMVDQGFITLDNLDAAWIDPETKSTHRIRTKDGVCKAKSFVGASLS